MDEQRVDLTDEIIVDEQGEEKTITTYKIKEPGTESRAITALVLGIVGIVMANMYTFFLAIPAGIVGIVFGKKARELTADGIKKGRGIATAGFICSIIAVCLAGLILVFYFLIFVWMLGSWPGFFGMGVMDNYI